MKLTNETKVGLLVGTTLVLIALFAWVIGVRNPFQQTVTLKVRYHFAGGIDVGSPVRVAGIKVGTVEKIHFLAPGAEAPLLLQISLRREAAVGVRSDSKFYINLAGLIGERYLEITPGTGAATAVQDGDTLWGEDPPRIDQLISQSFNLAGKIVDVIDKNEGDLSKSIKILYEMSANLNKLFAQLDKTKLMKTDLSQMAEFVSNMATISANLKTLTAKIPTPEGQRTLELLHKLLWRLEPLDKEALQEFLQKQGIRARLF